MPRTAKTARAKTRSVRVTLARDVAVWARRTAKRAGKPVGDLVDEVLRDKMRKDDAYEAAMREMLAIVKPVKFEKPGGRFPSRDEIYDRPKRWS